MTNKPRILILYSSITGNTKKVAETIYETVSAYIEDTELEELEPDSQIRYYDYDLIFAGTPVHHYLPPKPMIKIFEEHFFDETGPVLPAAPERPGHAAVVFCTFGGGHTGFREAAPTLGYIGQHFELAGIRVVAEWPVVGEFRQAGADYNKSGRLGDVSGRPNENDLQEIAGKTYGVLKQLALI